MEKEKILFLIKKKIDLLEKLKKNKTFQIIKNLEIDFFYKKILESNFFNEEIKIISKKFGEISDIKKRCEDRKYTFDMQGYKK
jgi:hypothetical protein